MTCSSVQISKLLLDHKTILRWRVSQKGEVLCTTLSLSPLLLFFYLGRVESSSGKGEWSYVQMGNLWGREHLGLSYLTVRASLMNGKLKQVVARMQLSISVQDGPVNPGTSQGLTLSFTKQRGKYKIYSMSNVLFFPFYFLFFNQRAAFVGLWHIQLRSWNMNLFIYFGEGGRGLGRSKNAGGGAPSSYSQMPVRCSQQTPLLGAWDGLV